MMPVKILVENIPQELHNGLHQMLLYEGFQLDSSGILITAEQSNHFSIHRSENALHINYVSPVQFFRGLSYLKQPVTLPFFLDTQPLFQRNGVMLDCSRNAVLKPDTVRMILRKMALMGLNTVMLYTEDTYEIEGLPYFGYLRGRYTQAELRSLDDYAADLGIELVPCIQTLAHLERALHWPQNNPELRDTEDILMVGEHSVYTLIDQMLRTVSNTFRTRTIHIGMDEAWALGLGNYRLKNGFVPSHQLMKEHLSRVKEIAEKYGLKPMMWSDMYLRAASPTGEYYNVPDQLPKSVLKAADPGVTLVYWDYYHEDPEIYGRLMDIHAQFEAPVIFAGGLWTWIGPAPSMDKMLRTSLPALEECVRRGISSVFTTAWGDNGGETNLLTALYGMQLYAEFDYTHCTHPDTLAQRFLACIGENSQAFLHLSDFNNLPGILPKTNDPVNASKFLLYEDPLLPLFEKDLSGKHFAEYYAELKQLYSGFTSEQPCFEALYRFYEALADLLSVKCSWREQAVLAQKGSAEARQLVLLANRAIQSCKSCKLAWGRLWELTNKPYGFEIIDLRMSGLIGRFETAARQMQQLADGEIDSIETLSCPKLRYLTDESGHFSGCYSWGECISACRI